jgi:hypothetical protein
MSCTVSVVDVDGVAPTHSRGPIELAPGTHDVTLKCGERTSVRHVTVAAGDVYEFAVLTGGSAGGVEGDLYKARSATK